MLYAVFLPPMDTIRNKILTTQVGNGSTVPNATWSKNPTRSRNPLRWYIHIYPTTTNSPIVGLDHRQNQLSNQSHTTSHALSGPISNQGHVRNQVFACKKCKKCFRKDSTEFEERYTLPHTYTPSQRGKEKIFK